VKQFELIDDFGSFCHKNAGKTGRTDVLERTAFSVKKCSQMFYWINEYKYLVEMVKFQLL
jgi:hypothetical protein